MEKPFEKNIKIVFHEYPIAERSDSSGIIHGYSGDALGKEYEVRTEWEDEDILIGVLSVAERPIFEGGKFIEFQRFHDETCKEEPPVSMDGKTLEDAGKGIAYILTV